MSATAGPPVLVVDDNRELASVIHAHLLEQRLSVLVAHSAADAENVFEAQPPAALITDLLLPDRTGHRMLARLARKGALPPVFVMTGVFRGVATRRQVAALAPLGGWFEKPFDIRVLVEAVCKVLRQPFRAPPARTAAEAKIASMYGAGGEGGAAVDPVFWDQNTQMAPASGVSLTASRSVITGVDPFRDAHTGFGRSSTPSATDMSVGLRTQLRAGDLRWVPVPRLLGAFNVARETGEVAFEGPDGRQIVYFEAGKPIFVVSNRAEDRIGTVVSKHFGLRSDQLQSATHEAQIREVSVPAVMKERGWVDPVVLDRVMQRHVHRMLLDLFRWAEGQYVIRFRRRPDLPRVELRDDMGTFVMNGVREWVPLGRLQELLPDDARPMPSPNPPFAWYHLPIHDAEAAALLRVTGSRTVRDLVADCSALVDERRLRAVVYGLLALGVLVSGRPDASAANGSPAAVSAGT